MRVLVTGASGFFGSHVAEQFAREGHDVRVLMRPTSSRAFLKHFPNQEAPGDVTDAESLPNAVRDTDAVVHVAGLIKARTERHFRLVNELGTANLLAAIESAAPDLKRFVYISSLAAHGPSTDGSPRPVEANPNPLTAYGRTKLGGELLTRQSPVADRSVIFRMPVIYGPRDPALMPFFQLARFRVAPLLMGGRNRISIVYAEDAARAVVQATTAEATVDGRTYSPEDGGVHSWRDMLSAVESAVGRRALRLSVPRWGYTTAATASEAFGFVFRRAVSLTREKVTEMAQRHWICSHETLKRDLGWTPAVGLDEGARLTYEWYREQRWL